MTRKSDIGENDTKRACWGLNWQPPRTRSTKLDYRTGPKRHINATRRAGDPALFERIIRPPNSGFNLQSFKLQTLITIISYPTTFSRERLHSALFGSSHHSFAACCSASHLVRVPVTHTAVDATHLHSQSLTMNTHARKYELFVYLETPLDAIVALDFILYVRIHDSIECSSQQIV